jgi:nucleoporin POM152
VRTSLQDLPDSAATTTLSGNPVIPVNLIDAPTQRLCTLAIYGLLFAWRLYDWWTLVEEDTKSISYFFKWCMIDLAYMFGVPLLRIPWLEWSDTASFLATIAHAVINMMLMFRIPVSYTQY